MVHVAKIDNDHNCHPRIIAGDVTSTVLYCWMAAIVEQLPGGKSKFVCTGTLVKQDLVVTSASCTHRSGQRSMLQNRIFF
jgi:V8-like Glu-specific endopeptidase